MVAGWRITIVSTDDDEVYYFGHYDGIAHWNVTQLEGDLYPRDLMAKSLHGQTSYGAVSLGCDNNEIAVTDGVTETSGKISVSDISLLSLNQNLGAKYATALVVPYMDMG